MAFICTRNCMNTHTHALAEHAWGSEFHLLHSNSRNRQMMVLIWLFPFLLSPLNIQSGSSCLEEKKSQEGSKHMSILLCIRSVWWVKSLRWPKAVICISRENLELSHVSLAAEGLPASGGTSSHWDHSGSPWFLGENLLGKDGSPKLWCWCFLHGLWLHLLFFL